VIAGYDHFSQKNSPLYTGYNIDNFYQFIGLNYNFKTVNTMGAFGVSESYMKLHPSLNKANYTSFWGVLGVSKKVHRWQFGLDGLYGYSFLNTNRYIDFLQAQAKSSHGAWTLSFDGKVSYKLEDDNFSFNPYDNISYVYGKENSYLENQAPGANQSVKDERISVIRNALGFMFEAPKDTWFKLFFDAAWVYDYYINSSSYLSAFEGTFVFGSYKQLTPTKNYARVHTGFDGNYHDFTWKLAYTGLYGQKLSDNAVTLDLGYKF
jgi:outer membrane autotransporter protein